MAKKKTKTTAATGTSKKPAAAKRKASAKKKASSAKTTKATARPRSKKKDGGRMGVLDAAAKVLRDAGKPMQCRQMVEVMLQKGWWSTKGKTPAATLYAAVIREIAAKGKDARFAKTDRGLFTLRG